MMSSFKKKRTNSAKHNLLAPVAVKSDGIAGAATW